VSEMKLSDHRRQASFSGSTRSNLRATSGEGSVMRTDDGFVVKLAIRDLIVYEAAACIQALVRGVFYKRRALRRRVRLMKSGVNELTAALLEGIRVHIPVSGEQKTCTTRILKLSMTDDLESAYLYFSNNDSESSSNSSDRNANRNNQENEEEKKEEEDEGDSDDGGAEDCESLTDDCNTALYLGDIAHVSFAYTFPANDSFDLFSPSDDYTETSTSIHGSKAFRQVTLVGSRARFKFNILDTKLQMKAEQIASCFDVLVDKALTELVSTTAVYLLLLRIFHFFIYSLST
jgi:ribosomal protein L12E/L44/L45/RPP1/RPP2